jgi:hypothetical protein
MVKELDLFESNPGCGLNGPSHAKHPKTAVTQHYTVQNWCVTSSQGTVEAEDPPKDTIKGQDADTGCITFRNCRDRTTAKPVPGAHVTETLPSRLPRTWRLYG